MELISNLFQFAVTLLGFCMSGIRYLKGRKRDYEKKSVNKILL